MPRASRRYLKKRAAELNANLPKSEMWFWQLWQLWQRVRMRTRTDQQNEPRYGLIPDVFNRRHYYIIEIDGSYHDLPEVQARDKVKNERFDRAGYLVIRVKAYDMESFNACVLAVKARRKEVDRTMERRRAKKLRQSQGFKR